jgi:hypothetical protein
MDLTKDSVFHALLILLQHLISKDAQVQHLFRSNVQIIQEGKEMVNADQTTVKLVNLISNLTSVQLSKNKAHVFNVNQDKLEHRQIQVTIMLLLDVD